MGAVLYLSFLLLVFCLSRAARAHLRGDAAALGLETVPDFVCRAVRRVAHGIAVTGVRVAVAEPGGVCYHVFGLMPDGRRVELDVAGDGTVSRHDGGQA